MDGLEDGVETKTGNFIDWDNTGTNPLLADTDGDGFDDRREIEDNTNPNDSFSHWKEPVDYGFLEIHVYAADYNFGDEPIARTHTKHHNSGDWSIDLPPGNYKVKIHSHQSTYKAEWYKGPSDLRMMSLGGRMRTALICKVIQRVLMLRLVLLLPAICLGL